MVKKKATKKATKAKKLTPTKAALEAADAMLAVPTALGAMAIEFQKVTLAMEAMEKTMRELVLKLAPHLASQLPPLPDNSSLLTEPSPQDRALLQEEFKHEPKGNIP